MTKRAILGVWILCALAAVPALADPKQDAKPHVAAADKAYKLGRFDEALASYSKAYEIYPAPPLLFNLGQCHRQLKNWERAVFFFEGYLRERPKAKNKALVEELLAESRRELEAQLAIEAKRKAEEDERVRREAEEAERLRIEAEKQRLEEERKVKVEAEKRRLEDERAAAERRRLEEERVLRERRDREAAEERERNKLYRKWWFWSAIGGVLAAGGATAYYFSGSTTTVDPSGSLGGLDRR